MINENEICTFQEPIQDIARQLFEGISAEMSGKPWKSAFADIRWDGDGTKITKLRVNGDDGKVFSLLDTPYEHIPLHLRQKLQEIWEHQAGAFEDRFYGILISISYDGECELKFSYDSQCAGDAEFFNT